APADPNAAPAAPEDPALADPNRVNNAAGGFSFVPPPGWTVGDASRLNYGQALLTKTVEPAAPGAPAPEPATDTSILLGRLDLKLFAGAEPDNAKAARRLASDMGEFFMPFPGTRLNQSSAPLDAGGMTGSAEYYEVKFTDESKPAGQIWAGVVGDAGVNLPREQRNQRWFVVWLGTANDPIDQAAATALANSIRQWTPPPAEPAPAADPNAAPAADLPPGAMQPGEVRPVENPDPAMLPPA
ncbi:APA family fibronectin-binding glycoprotein, partial [Mycolicibacterium brumae]